MEKDGIDPKQFGYVPRPDVPEYLSQIINSYDILSRSREQSGRIPLSAIDSYLNIFPYYDKEFFIQVTYAIDDEVFEHNKRQMEKELNKGIK